MTKKGLYKCLKVSKVTEVNKAEKQQTELRFKSHHNVQNSSEAIGCERPMTGFGIRCWHSKLYYYKTSFRYQSSEMELQMEFPDYSSSNNMNQRDTVSNINLSDD
jgi:hypothetical protein